MSFVDEIINRLSERGTAILAGLDAEEVVYIPDEDTLAILDENPWMIDYAIRVGMVLDKYLKDEGLELADKHNQMIVALLTGWMPMLVRGPKGPKK